ncbi:MAG: FHA domain-containing protein [Actinobacteria bacterium]|nr:FHA domain-containing protein [Actinomycetota bacterium]
MSSIPCRSCSHKNDIGARFCSSCGAELQRSVEDRTEGLDLSDKEVFETDLELASGLKNGAALIVAAGHRAGSRFILEQDFVTVGRHPESDVFLDDITVSRKHIELRLSPLGYSITDSGSLNGTYLNGERIEEEAILLTNGDELQIGKFKLLFLVSKSGI